MFALSALLIPRPVSRTGAGDTSGPGRPSDVRQQRKLQKGEKTFLEPIDKTTKTWYNVFVVTENHTRIGGTITMAEIKKSPRDIIKDAMEADGITQ